MDRARRRIATEEGGGAGGGAPCPVNVTRQSSSGPLITTPKVVLLWWSTYFWDRHLTERHYYRDALQAVGNDAAFWNRLSEYGVTGGSVAGTLDLTRFGGPSASVSEYLQRFYGHHQTYTYNGQNVWYAVVEYSTDTRTALNVITHEVYEAATDPDVSTGYWDPANGGEKEIGDLCNLQTEIIDGYPVQQVWSQKAANVFNPGVSSHFDPRRTWFPPATHNTAAVPASKIAISQRVSSG